MYALRRFVRAITVPVVLVLVAAACTDSSGGKAEQESGAVKEGGTLRIGTSSGLISPNPFVGFNQDDYSTWMQIYPSLLQYDTTTPTYEYMPGFASEWEQSEDGLTVTFHTLPDAKWSDGEPLTADDAAWTFNMIKKYADGPTGTWAGTVQFLKKIEATDANTLVATYEKPSGTGLFDLGFAPILPPQVWEKCRHGRRQGHRDVRRTSPRTESRSWAEGRSS